ncbi:hypothetical protein CgunFtcFv8_011695 [Champsocephalus gunnari]|uniref:Uncharacterized protein n=1 Tax=Champsocephalus gunnari TaxID=52237 RepID=A0AAN8D9Q1_CHAGU|nr:hypothetical protein CgunFtcFv8_011695 [Champsocephalus gunnari]
MSETSVCSALGKKGCCQERSGALLGSCTANRERMGGVENRDGPLSTSWSQKKGCIGISKLQTPLDN